MGNVIREAMDVLGSSEAIAVALHVCNGTVRFWLKIGRIPRADHAVKLAQALRRKGHPIPVARLAGIIPKTRGSDGARGARERRRAAS